MSSRFPTNRDPSLIASPTSRRALLGAIVVAPAALPVLAGTGGADTHLAAGIYETPVVLRRTRAGRDLSRARYRNAEAFFAGIGQGIGGEGADLLYRTGIVMQLGLCAHLIDVGIDDAWCARHLGLHLDRSLALANMTGLGLDAPEIEQLARFLSPYGQWRHADIGRRPVHPYAADDLRRLARALLDHVRMVTRHALPARKRQSHG